MLRQLTDPPELRKVAPARHIHRFALPDHQHCSSLGCIDIRQWRIVGNVFTFIESSIFGRVLPAYLDDDEYTKLQQYLIENPETGELIPGSGGVRKVRWARPGTGKRGGLRIIYFVRYRPNEFWMLVCKSKARECSCAHSQTVAGGV